MWSRRPSVAGGSGDASSSSPNTPASPAVQVWSPGGSMQRFGSQQRLQWMRSFRRDSVFDDKHVAAGDATPADSGGGTFLRKMAVAPVPMTPRALLARRPSVYAAATPAAAADLGDRSRAADGTAHAHAAPSDGTAADVGAGGGATSCCCADPEAARGRWRHWLLWVFLVGALALTGVAAALGVWIVVDPPTPRLTDVSDIVTPSTYNVTAYASAFTLTNGSQLFTGVAPTLTVARLVVADSLSGVALPNFTVVSRHTHVTELDLSAALSTTRLWAASVSTEALVVADEPGTLSVSVLSVSSHALCAAITAQSVSASDVVLAPGTGNALEGVASVSIGAVLAERVVASARVDAGRITSAALESVVSGSAVIVTAPSQAHVRGDVTTALLAFGGSSTEALSVSIDVVDAQHATVTGAVLAPTMSAAHAAASALESTALVSVNDTATVSVLARVQAGASLRNLTLGSTAPRVAALQLGSDARLTVASARTATLSVSASGTLRVAQLVVPEANASLVVARSVSSPAAVLAASLNVSGLRATNATVSGAMHVQHDWVPAVATVSSVNRLHVVGDAVLGGTLTAGARLSVTGTLRSAAGELRVAGGASFATLDASAAHVVVQSLSTGASGTVALGGAAMALGGVSAGAVTSTSAVRSNTISAAYVTVSTLMEVLAPVTVNDASAAAFTVVAAHAPALSAAALSVADVLAVPSGAALHVAQLSGASATTPGTASATTALHVASSLTVSGNVVVPGSANVGALSVAAVASVASLSAPSASVASVAVAGATRVLGALAAPPPASVVTVGGPGAAVFAGAAFGTGTAVVAAAGGAQVPAAVVAGAVTVGGVASASALTSATASVGGVLESTQAVRVCGLTSCGLTVRAADSVGYASAVSVSPAGALTASAALVTAVLTASSALSTPTVSAGALDASAAVVVTGAAGLSASSLTASGLLSVGPGTQTLLTPALAVTGVLAVTGSVTTSLPLTVGSVSAVSAVSTSGYLAGALTAPAVMALTTMVSGDVASGTSTVSLLNAPLVAGMLEAGRSSVRCVLVLTRTSGNGGFDMILRFVPIGGGTTLNIASSTVPGGGSSSPVIIRVAIAPSSSTQLLAYIERVSSAALLSIDGRAVANYNDSKSYSMSVLVQCSDASTSWRVTLASIDGATRSA